MTSKNFCRTTHLYAHLYPPSTLSMQYSAKEMGIIFFFIILFAKMVIKNIKMYSLAATNIL